MRILVDADSCAKLAREILEKAQCRLNFSLIYVANRSLKAIVPSVDLKLVISEDVDAYLLEKAEIEDLIITRDLPLMRQLAIKGISCMSDRGKIYGYKELELRLTKRDWNYNLVRAGLLQPKTLRYTNEDKKTFAEALDQWLTLNGRE